MTCRSNGPRTTQPAPLVGWRAWQLYHDGSAWRLSSPHFRTPWNPHERVQAACLASRHMGHRINPHTAPHRDCHCGIYAAHDLNQIDQYISGATPDALRVYGRVNLWGTVLECDRGWRAELAYPAELVVPVSADRAVIAWDLAAYGVPVLSVSFEEAA